MYENYTVLRQILSIIVEKKIKRSRGNPRVKRALCRPEPRYAFFCFSQVLTYFAFFNKILKLNCK